MPVAIITEEFDFSSMTQGEDLLLIDLHHGWQPQQIGFIPGASEQQMPKLLKMDFAAYIGQKLKTLPVQAPVGGVGQPPVPQRPGEGLTFLDPIVPAGRWGGNKGGVQVWDLPEVVGQASSLPGNDTILSNTNGGKMPSTLADKMSAPLSKSHRSIGLIPLFAGSWRRSMALDVWYQKDQGIVISLPISVRYSRWSLEVTDDHSPFSTHEHDPGLKATYGRRVWGLYTGANCETAQAHFGYIGLDRYKDWIIDYPEGTVAKGAYPGGLFRADLVKRLCQSIDQHPQADWLKQRYLISGKTEDAIKNAEEVISRLKHPYQENDFYYVGLSNYRKLQLLMFANRAEDALACPELPSALRQELRRRLALYAYVTSEPDWNPRGAGVHLGNNNMPINRTLALALFASLLPDHPRYGYWMDRVRQYTQFKLASQTAPDGVDIECPTYHTYAPAQAINIALNALGNGGFDPKGLQEYYRAKLIWLANLTMPDPRWNGDRIIPGMGNSGNTRESIWGASLATFTDDPKFAGWLKYVFTLGGKRFGTESTGVTSVGHAMYYLPDIPENPEPLTTTFFPTYGVMFRHHFNTPNETALLFRSGMNWGHWDTDALNTILYAKGAPLSPGTGYQYYSGPATENNAIYHNQVKIGKRDAQECFGRVDATVADYGFGPSADYAVGSRFYPSQIFGDGQGPVTWNRHILFLKSDQPQGNNYFVLRDTFKGAQRPTWWQWLNLDTADLIHVDDKAFTAESTPLEKNVPENQFPKLRGQTVEMKTKYSVSSWFWFSESRDVRLRMTFNAANETKTIVDIPGAVGQDYFYTVYPRKEGAPLPSCTLLAPGVLKIQTPESKDIIFIGDTSFDWNQEGAIFKGKAGAVRIYPDRVVFCMNAGSGKIGYQGYVLDGSGPFERTVSLAEFKLGVRKLPGGYEKKTVLVDAGQGITVTGEGPFTVVVDQQQIKIKTAGRARVLHVTQPSFIVFPQYFIDGQEWMACWTDYPNNGWGTYDQTWLMGLTVPEGEHNLTIQERVFPTGWTRPFAPLIAGALTQNGLEKP